MIINKTQNGTSLVIAPEGRLDTSTARELEEELKNSLNGVTDLVFDFIGLEYITSAGLRAMLFAHKAMRGKGRMVVKNANEIVREVFELTGFSGILTVE